MAENDQEFHVDETPAPAVPVPVTQEQQVSGAQYNSNVPGNEAFYVSGGGGGMQPGYNAVEEFLTMPFDDPGKYLPRAIFTEKQLVQDIAINARLQRMCTGFENPLESMWRRYAGSPGIDGVGRRQALVIATGDRQVDISGRSGGFMANIASRLAGNQNGKLNGD